MTRPTIKDRLDTDSAVADGTGREAEPFWRTKSLEQMDAEEWESLCDGCGRCCLVKLQDEDTEAIAYTDIGCKLLDDVGCRCRDYPNRQAQVPDCVRLTPQTVRAIDWLPPSCAYRLVEEGRDLYWWHHLVSGDRDTVHAAGVSVRGRVEAMEDDLPLEDYIEHMVRWPLRLPRGAMRRPADPARGRRTAAPPTVAARGTARR